MIIAIRITGSKALCCGLLLTAAFQFLEAYPTVAFEERTQWINEGSSAELVLTLSERSFLTVEIPFFISTDSTADFQEDPSDDEEEHDYYIIESDSEYLGYTFDPDTLSGTIFLEPGTLEYSLSIYSMADLLIEGDEAIFLRIEADEVTVARPVQPLEHTIVILDNDDETEQFLSLTEAEIEVGEGGSAFVSMSLNSAAEEDIIVTYSITFNTASEDDLDMEAMDGLTGTITLEEGTSSDTITIYTQQDILIEDAEETLTLTILDATGEETASSYPIEDNAATITIVDNDPTLLAFTLIDDEDNFQTVIEGATVSIQLELSGSLPEDLEVPLNFTGLASQGDEDDDLNEIDYYVLDELPIVMESGTVSASITLVTKNDDLLEDLETIIVTLGTPFMTESGTSIGLESPQEFTVELEDNDPVTLSIGRLNPDYDAEDDESEEPYYISSEQSIIGESFGEISLPLFLSDWVSHDITFDLTLDMDGTSATPYDPDLDTDGQDWDFQISSSIEILYPDKPTIEVTIPSGYTEVLVNIQLNDNEESSYVFGQPVPDDVEDDETIRFTISNVQSDSDTLQLGAATAHVVTIRDLPEIDVTDAFQQISIDRSGWLDGQPPYNKATGSHELVFDFVPPSGPYDLDLTGYNSYKVVYDLSFYTESGDGEFANDPLKTFPNEPDTNEEFEYFVYFPFEVRHPGGYIRKVIAEGVDPKNEKVFEEENADTVSYSQYILQPLDLPSLEPQYDVDTELTQYDPTDPFRWDLDFGNSGIAEFPTNRLDLGTFPENLRIYLSPESLPTTAPSNFSSASVYRLVEKEDGRIFLEIDTASVGSIQIQYLDENGDWRVANPAVINTTGSRLFWTDRGPPGTDLHPSEVSYRIYRVYSNP